MDNLEGSLFDEKTKDDPVDVFEICRTCGNCCRDTTPLISKDDIKRWKEEGREDILKELEPYQLWHTLKRNDGACIFFDGEKCRIHETKPGCCRNFPHDKKSGQKVNCNLV